MDPLAVSNPSGALLVDLLERALRSQAGVRHNKRENKPTGFYSGRCAGFVASAASLCHRMYGVDEEAAKNVISKKCKDADERLAKPEPPFTRQEEALRIATSALLA